MAWSLSYIGVSGKVAAQLRVDADVMPMAPDPSDPARRAKIPALTPAEFSTRQQVLVGVATSLEEMNVLQPVKVVAKGTHIGTPATKDTESSVTATLHVSIEPLGKLLV